MSAISPEVVHDFKSAEGVYSRVRRFLSSFASTNLIDEGEFPTYTNDVLRLLGVGVMKEEQAIMKIKNHKAPLPEDFNALYAAYKCTQSFSTKETTHLQGNPTTVFHDVTWELLQTSGACQINSLCTEDSRILEKVTVRQFVKDEPVTGSFINPILLRPSPNVRPNNMCTDDCENLLATSAYEFTIDKKHIYTNFTDDCVYMKYWANARDERGVPLIPDVERVERAIEWYIIFQLTYKWWFNGSVPDIKAKMDNAEAEYGKWFEQAKYELKFPSFSRAVNLIRRKRKINTVQLFRQSLRGTWMYC